LAKAKQEVEQLWQQLAKAKTKYIAKITKLKAKTATLAKKNDRRASILRLALIISLDLPPSYKNQLTIIALTSTISLVKYLNTIIKKGLSMIRATYKKD